MNTLLMLFIFVPILAVLLLGLNLLLAAHKPDEAKVSAYECGFSPVYGQTRSTFQIHFFKVALLFLIFDLEVLLLYPLAVTLYKVSVFGFSVAIIFFIVLTIGFILEIGSGAISIKNSDIKIFNNPHPNYNS
jgi:NADH-ubiquinone oxidoreductase chain 3